MYNSPLLITGPGRTGSTALARALNLSNLFSITHEWGLYCRSIGAIRARISKLREKGPDVDNFPSCSSISQKELIELNKTGEFDKDLLFDMLFKEAKVYGDKMPRAYLRNFEETMQQYRKAKFLITIRDGRGTIASQIRNDKNKHFWALDTIEECCTHAEGNWLLAMHNWERMKPMLIERVHYLEIRYEEATTNPEQALREICNFVDIEFKIEDWKKSLDYYKPTHLDAWKEELPDMEQKLTNEFVECLRRWNYE